MGLPLLIGIGAAAGAAGGLGGYLSGKKKGSYDINPYGNLNPEQIATNKSLGTYFGGINNDMPSYGGQYTADLTPEEQNVLDQNARLSSLAEGGLSTMLSGEFPEDYYQNSIYKPMMKQYKEDVQPGIEEAYAGQWSGTPRANAVAKGYRDLTDTLAAKRADLAWQARNAVPEAVSAMNSMGTSSALIQAIPREIKQYGLDKQYSEWTRGQEAKQQYVNQALQFLGISTGTATYNPPEPSFWGSMLSGISGGVLTGLGAGMGSSTTGSTVAKPVLGNA
jgi:hypothetical protein